MSESRARDWKPGRAALALLALHALLAAPFPWENLSLAGAWLRFQPDWLLLLSAGLVVASWRGRAGFLLSHGLTVVLLFLPLLRFGKTLMPVFYGKEFELVMDSTMVPGLIHLLTHTYSLPVQLAMGLGTLLVLGLVYFVVCRCVGGALSAAVSRRFVAGFVIFSVVVGGAWGIERLARDRDSALVRPSMLAELVRQSEGVWEAWNLNETFRIRAEQAEQQLAGTPTNLSRLGNVDVYVLFLESYGATLLRSPGTRLRFEEWAAPLEAKLSNAGFRVGSGYFYPSISGGASSLAHAELLTGVSVDNRWMFERVLASSLKALPKFFQEAGYRTYNVQPAMPEEWPEGKFFGFTDDVFQRALGYDGVTYPWGEMPDQFALAHVLQQITRPSETPVFVQYISVTSHAPFSMIPPYVADWNDASDATAYATPRLQYDIHWGNYVGHPEVEEAYLESIDYSLETSIGFVEQLERDSLVIILGDHQPPLVGDLMAEDPSFDVPVHLISNRPSLLGPFASLGFAEGMVPPEDQGSFSFAAFLVTFLRIFSEE